MVSLLFQSKRLLSHLFRQEQELFHENRSMAILPSEHEMLRWVLGTRHIYILLSSHKLWHFIAIEAISTTEQNLRKAGRKPLKNHFLVSIKFCENTDEEIGRNLTFLSQELSHEKRWNLEYSKHPHILAKQWINHSSGTIILTLGFLPLFVCVIRQHSNCILEFNFNF